MIRIVFAQRNEVQIQEVERPHAGAGKVVIETSVSLISTGTECRCLSGDFDAGSGWAKWVTHPFEPGYSNVGRIVEIGPGVQGWNPGDRVASTGTHSQFIVTSARQLWRVPEAVNDDEAAWATVSNVVQHGFRKAGVLIGDVVVVVGLGMLGQLAAQYSRLAGAGEVIVIDPAQSRLRFARPYATHLLACDVHEARKTVEEVTGGKKANIVFDMTGHPEVFTGALRLLRRFGKLVLIGTPGSVSEQRLTEDVIGNDLQIIGAHGTNPPAEESDYAPWTRTRMAELFFKFVERGQINVKDLNTHRFPPRQAREAYDLLMRSRENAMGVLFDFRQL